MRRAVLIPAMTVIALSAAMAAQAEDRYGPSPAHAADQPEPLATLTWPGKAAAQLTPRAEARDPAPPQPSAPTSLYDPRPPRWRSADPLPPRPASVPAQAETPVQNGPQPPHFYSVARQYGVQPDPVQLSPQFLAATPQSDLAEPPPLPPHAIGAQSANMSASVATNQLRQAQQAAAEADSAALEN